MLSKLEIDVTHAADVKEAVELSVKYQIPTIVSHPSLASDLRILRVARQGLFSIIVPIDWPNGDLVGSNKFRGLSSDAINADGFEFMVNCTKKTESQLSQEINNLINFVKQQISGTAEIRFVFGSCLSQDLIKKVFQALTYTQTPNLIRSDINTKIQSAKANSDTHNEFINIANSIKKMPLKLSGNLSSVKSISSCPGAYRYSVNLQQAKSIIKEITQQPDKVREMLSS